MIVESGTMSISGLYHQKAQRLDDLEPENPLMTRTELEKMLAELVQSNRVLCYDRSGVKYFILA